MSRDGIALVDPIWIESEPASLASARISHKISQEQRTTHFPRFAFSGSVLPFHILVVQSTQMDCLVSSSNPFGGRMNELKSQPEEAAQEYLRYRFGMCGWDRAFAISTSTPKPVFTRKQILTPSKSFAGGTNSFAPRVTVINFLVKLFGVRRPLTHVQHLVPWAQCERYERYGRFWS